MSREIHQVLRRPLLTEKNMRRSETQNQFTFEVHPDSNRVEIRKAVEELFKVRVKDVSTMNVRGKRKRQGFSFHMGGSMKKAIVTLHEDDTIDLI